MRKTTFLVIAAFGAASCSLVSAPALSAQEELSASLLRAETDPNSEFLISVWQTGDGLPVNVIDDLRQTPDGYLWLGTHQGLVRFDGMRFETFFRTPTGARYGPRVGPLEIDARGRLWIAPDQIGLAYLEAGSFVEVLTNETVLRGRATSLCSDGRDGLLWADARGGLGRVSIERPAGAERFRDRAGVAAQWLRDFECNLWLVNPRRLRLYEAGKLREIGPPDNAVRVVAPRRQGGLWIASRGRLHSMGTNGVLQEVASLPWVGGGNRVTCLLEDSDRRLWIGTASQGLFCYAAGRFKQVVPAASTILCLLEDSEDNLWAGTRGGGLVRLRRRCFFVHDRHGGLDNPFVNSLAQDQTGRVWIVSAEGGLGWWLNGSWHPLGQAEGWPGVEALAVLPARDGTVWISTVGRELWRWSNGQFTKYNFLAGPPREPAADLLEDRHGRLWMVTDNSGVSCLEGNTLSNYSPRQGLPSQLIRRLVEDEAGVLWAGDWEGGLARWQGQRWELVRPSSGHPDAVRTIVACEGALWIGTSAGGLLRLKDGRTARVSVEQGLPDNCIQQLLPDGRGSLWGGTAYKLFRLPLPQLNDVMDGRAARVEAITYGHSDGLPEVSFAFWNDPRCWRAADGELWFATANGAIHFHPENLPASQPPQALLEEFLLDGQPMTRAALQHLRPGPGRLEFRFTAPCLTAPERVRFRYQLAGVDPNWVEAGTARSAIYGSLPAGEHLFRVAASSPEGVWSAATASVAFAVHPYFWQTHWFFAALAAGGAGGAVWLVRRATVRRLNRRLERLRQRHAVEQERTRIAQDIHDELGANLTSIGLLADMGARHKSDPATVTRDLEHISRTARESVAAMDAIVWALNPRNNSLDHFANYIAQFTRDFFRPTSLRTRLDLPANLPAQPLTTDTRHQLFLLVKESFNNIVRHAQASEVRLELACQNSCLRLTVADDGKGLSEKTMTGAGQDGLANLHERIARLGGTLRIESQPGKGTRLDFTLPLGKARVE